jgi:hypothetical protein
MPLTTDGFGALPYDRATQCLEVRFTWKNVHQYRPVPLKVVREIWKARPMNMALDTLVMKNRRIRFEEVAPKEAARVVATWLGDNIFVNSRRRRRRLRYTVWRPRLLRRSAVRFVE